MREYISIIYNFIITHEVKICLILIGLYILMLCYNINSKKPKVVLAIVLGFITISLIFSIVSKMRGSL